MPSKESSTPNYEGIVRFLVEPFLETSDSLRIYSERFSNGEKVWVRVAFASEDRGRVFGRGGRNIQAIRAVLEATGTLVGQRARLDVYGESPAREEGDAPRERSTPPVNRQRRSGGDDRPRLRDE